MPESRYRFSVDHENEDGRTIFRNELEFEAEQLSDVIGNFELFLKGAGFSFDGHVDINPDDFTKYNTYNNRMGGKPDESREWNMGPDVGAERWYKRPDDTEGGTIE